MKKTEVNLLCDYAGCNETIQYEEDAIVVTRGGHLYGSWHFCSGECLVKYVNGTFSIFFKKVTTP